MGTSSDVSCGSQKQPNLPPGFRFHPTDEELVVHYLKKKASSSPLPVTIIAEIDLYKFDPWELPGKATFGEHEWYFFSPRDRKYPNGARPNRAATSGYWKATGTDKPILTCGGTQKVGVKKALVFYGGKPPKGIKTDWIMHEYRLIDNNNTKMLGSDSTGKKRSLRLDDWVLCRIYRKNNNLQRPVEREKEETMNDLLISLPQTMGNQNNMKEQSNKLSYGDLLTNEDNFFDGLLGDGGSTCSIMTQLPSSTSKTILPSTNPRDLHQFKGITPSLWTDISSFIPAEKGLHREGDTETSSLITIYNQIPQNVSIHNGSIIGCLDDGAFRQELQFSGMNWNP